MRLFSIGTRRIVLGLFGALLVAAMVYVFMRSGPLAPTRVTVVQAAEGRLTPALFGIGTVEARRSYLIGPTADGRVRSVVVDVGDGVVTSRDAEPGSTVVAGQAVLRVIEPSSLWVKLRLDQGRSAGLAAGLPAQVVLRSNPRRAIAGKVARVEGVSDSVTEERVAQVSFDQAPAGLLVGELVEVTLSLPATANAVLRPSGGSKRKSVCG